MHDDSGRGNIDYGVTDASGRVALKNNSYSRVRVLGISGDMASIEDYKNYYLDKGIRLHLATRNQLLNQWEPYPLEVTHVLKRIKNPVPMIAQNEFFKAELSAGRVYPGKLNEVLGYDMVSCDWTPPYGSGKIVDIQITLIGEWPEPQSKNRRLKALIKIPGQGNGVQAYKRISFEGGSTLFHPHEAPEGSYVSEFMYDSATDNGYANSLIFRIRSDGEKSIYAVSQRFDMCYVARPKHYPPGVKTPPTDINYWCFAFKLNPDSKSRSLEWNGVDARTGKLVRENWREDQRP